MSTEDTGQTFSGSSASHDRQPEGNGATNVMRPHELFNVEPVLRAMLLDYKRLTDKMIMVLARCNEYIQAIERKIGQQEAINTSLAQENERREENEAKLTAQKTAIRDLQTRLDEIKNIMDSILANNVADQPIHSITATGRSSGVVQLNNKAEESYGTS
jgi:hypothetical protein